ncbi:thioester-forming surface-anchored protein, partial [Streptococcus equi]
MKTKSFRKVLTTSATCIVLATSFAGGTLRVWAEQLYYGWNDGTRQYSPFFLYATPTTESQRKLETIVYCFNRNNHWPDNWESSRTSPTSLPLYNKEVGTNELFKKTATTPKKSDKLIESLIVVLSKGYPNVKHIENLREDQSRKITQLAIWYFSDSFSKEHFRTTYGLTSEEDQALQNLIKAGENPDLSEAQKKQTLDLYIYKSGGTGYSGGYQNLLGSTLIPRIDGFGGQNHHKLDGLKGELPGLSGEAGAPEKPGTFGKNDKPLNGLEGGKTDLPDGEKGEAGPPATPQKPNDPLQGLEGGNSPIVEQNYGSTEGYHGQSGILEETEDTNPPGIILGGSGNVETHEDTRDPHLMGLGGGLAGESGETTPKPGQTGGHGPIIETTEDTQKGMSGQSGGTIESENTKKPEVMIGGQGQTIETTEDTQKGMSGQSGGTIESEDTKKPEVMIGGQGQIIDFSENTQSGMSGQSGDTTVIEDTKKSEIITGGQGQIIDFSEDTQPGMSGQSGG